MDNDGIVTHLKEWVELRLAQAKLSLIECVAMIVATILGIVVALILAAFGLVFLAWLFTHQLGVWIGSQEWAIAIVGVALIGLAVVAWMARGRIFGNLMIGSLSKLFFKTPADDEN